MEYKLSFQILMVSSILAMFLLAGIALAAVTSNSDQATVDIVVANKTLIDISPNSVTFSGFEPGQVSAADTSFDLENLGSKPIQYITADITTLPTSDPYGTGTAANYNAGDYVALSVDHTTATSDPTVTDVNQFYFVHTRSFNESADKPRYLTVVDTSHPFEGRFRFDNEEFFWEVVPDTSGVWGNGTIYISDSGHNQTVLGDVDLSNNVGTTLTKSASDDNVGYATVSIPLDTGTQYYCAVVNATASPAYVDLERYTDFATTNCGTGASDGGEYILGQTNEGNLEPGQTKGLNLGVRIAYGVFEGNIGQGILEITATSAW